MAGKAAFFEKKFINRTLRRTSTAVNGANASTTNILVTSSTGFDPGDLIKLTTPGTYHLVTAVPDGTHVTISPAAGVAPTTGNVDAWGYSPAAVYVALYTVAPTDSTAGTEVSGGNYARVQITQADSNWAAPSGTPSSTNNSNVVTFGVPSASWGTVVAVALVDTSSGTTNIIYWNTLTNSKNVNNGDPAPTFPTSSLTLSED